MKHDIHIKTKNINNIFQLKQLLIYKHVNINMNFAIAFYIKAAIINKNKIDLIKRLINKKVKLIKIIINIKR